MASPHPLDRPAWSALTTGWAKLAQGSPTAWRLAPQYGPFAAAADASPESLAALAALDFGETGLWLVETQEQPLPPGTSVAVSAPCWQMTAQGSDDNPVAFRTVPLGDADAAEMLALALLTKPGPFSTHTHQLSQFIGVKQDGRLVAMAGERMRCPGFAEVSGVCTHPDFRGRGYAAGLMRLVSRRILARGETPFLHTYEANTGAIELYKTLGFSHRVTVMATVLKRS